MLRRSFLLAGAATLGAQTPPTPKAKITSAAALWTLAGSMEERLATVARAGVQAVELASEWESWSDADLARFAGRRASFRLGVAALAGRSGALDRAFTMARKLEATQVTLAGEVGRDAAVRAADLAARSGLSLLLAPAGRQSALALVREAAHPHLRLVFDIFEEHARSGNIATAVTEAAPFVGVFRAADSPGRREPLTGDIPYRDIYKAIRKSGFSGHLCFAYQPPADAAASLIRAVNGFRAG
jgi:hydroxypyruvate isomerase